MLISTVIKLKQCKIKYENTAYTTNINMNVSTYNGITFSIHNVELGGN